MRREEARWGNEGEEHMRKHEGNTTDGGSQRGEHRRQLKDKRHKRAWKFNKGNTQGNLKDTWGHGKTKHETQDMIQRHKSNTRNKKPDTRTHNANRNHDMGHVTLLRSLYFDEWRTCLVITLMTQSGLHTSAPRSLLILTHRFGSPMLRLWYYLQRCIRCLNEISPLAASEIFP